MMPDPSTAGPDDPLAELLDVCRRIRRAADIAAAAETSRDGQIIYRSLAGAAGHAAAWAAMAAAWQRRHPDSQGFG